MTKNNSHIHWAEVPEKGGEIAYRLAQNNIRTIYRELRAGHFSHGAFEPFAP